MLDTLLAPPLVPFTLALELLFALLAVELVMLARGAALIGDAGDAPEIGVEADGVDLDFDLDPDLDLATGQTPAAPSPSLLGWLGFG
ncbi:MAG: hypothetical protein N4A39_07310, partial [Roseicyclus sp.]|nr:hypothetical protein [Roseicyclus sp.]